MKKQDLTEEELGILYQMLAARRWGAMSYDLAMLLPTMLITSYGIWTGNPIVTSVGLLAYVMGRLWAAFYQDQTMPTLQSGIRKLLEQDSGESENPEA